MALISCPECKKGVSDTAVECPHCGFDVASMYKKKQKLSEDQKKREKRQSASQAITGNLNQITSNKKPSQLNQYGKKSFWILAGFPLYLCLVLFLSCLSDIIYLWQISDSFSGWFTRMVELFASVFLNGLTIYVIYCAFYITANIIKSKRIAKIILVLGLICNIFILVMPYGIPPSIDIWNMQSILCLICYSIPLIVYIILFCKAIYVKK